MAITFPASIWTTYTWPYPRVWSMQQYNLAAAIYSGNVCLFELEYDMVNEQWDAYYVCLMGDVDDISQIDVGDFGTYYTVSVLGHDSNGDAISASWERIPHVFEGVNSLRILPSDNMPAFITSCNYHGQIVVGGITDFSTYLTGIDGDVQQSYVWWSGIGSHEFRPNCDPTAGFLQAPWQKVDKGEVLKVETLGKGVIVYGDYGALLLKHVVVENASTFGFERVSGPGIISGNHMDGDGSLHCFVDTNNELWLADAGHKFEKLGYKEYIKDLNNKDIIMTYVPQKKRFFFSDGIKGYCLTEFGLYSTNQLVTGVGIQKEIL